MLRRPDEDPLEDCSLAFGICKITAEQNHVALIYKNEKSEPMLLHHGWHRDTRNHAWDNKYYSVPFQSLDVELQETFADWALEVAPRLVKSEIPYGVFYNLKANFGTDGKFIDRGDQSGHTCATFLLDLFYSYGLPLLDLMSWPEKREGDLEWQEKMLNILHNSGVIALDEAKRQYSMKLRRFRPEEVASTAELYINNPLKFDEVQASATAIVKQLSSD